MRRLIAVAALAALALGACATAAPRPYIDDMSESMVKVGVNFTAFSGPPWENAKEATDGVAARHCAIYRKAPQLASSSSDGGVSGTYYFLYRCLERRGE